MIKKSWAVYFLSYLSFIGKFEHCFYNVSGLNYVSKNDELFSTCGFAIWVTFILLFVVLKL